MAAFAVQFKTDTDSLRSFLDACDRASFDTKKQIETTLEKVGELVRGTAVARMLPKHAPSAAGYRSRVQPRAVRVEQTRPKTTGQHPDWGGWQMRNTLLPALYRNQDRIDREFLRATDAVCDRFEKG
jgi:hypothetical protein